MGMIHPQRDLNPRCLREREKSLNRWTIGAEGPHTENTKNRIGAEGRPL